MWLLVLHAHHLFWWRQKASEGCGFYFRGAVRLFADFYDADVIVASPLGLAALVTDQKADASAGAADFLSSIEICVLDRADVLLMQNWAHVLTGAAAIWSLALSRE